MYAHSYHLLCINKYDILANKKGVLLIGHLTEVRCRRGSIGHRAASHTSGSGGLPYPLDASSAPAHPPLSFSTNAAAFPAHPAPPT